MRGANWAVQYGMPRTYFWFSRSFSSMQYYTQYFNPRSHQAVNVQINDPESQYTTKCCRALKASRPCLLKYSASHTLDNNRESFSSRESKAASSSEERITRVEAVEAELIACVRSAWAHPILRLWWDTTTWLVQRLTCSGLNRLHLALCWGGVGKLDEL